MTRADDGLAVLKCHRLFHRLDARRLHLLQRRSTTIPTFKRGSTR